MRGALLGCGGYGLIKILLDFAAQRAGIDDSAFHRAQQAVRKRGQRGCRGRVGLHPSAPRAQQEPQEGQRQPGDALRAECRDRAQYRYQNKRDQHQTGPQPEPMSGGNARRKEPGRMEQRDGAQTCRGRTVEALSEGGGGGLHRT